MNNKRESASVVEQVMQEYEERLRGPVPLFAADGSAVRREGFDEFVHTEAQFAYFEENIWGKDERYPNTGGSSYTAYQAWLTDTYGKSTAQKINDAVFSLDGLQVALDIAGFVLPPADLMNAFISHARGKKLDAAIDFVAAVPWLGDLYKYSKVSSKIGKAIDGLEFTYKVTDAATAFTGKVAKTLDALDIAMGAKREYKLISNGIEITVDARTAAKILDNVSDAKSMAKSADIIDNLYTSGKIINNLSDAGSAVKSGSNVVDAARAMEGAGDASKYIYRGKDVSSGLKVSAKILNEAGDVISISKSMDLAELAKLTGHSVEELTDILKYLGMNADDLASLLKGGTLYDILGVSPAKIISSIPYNTYDQMKAAYKGTWGAWSKANKPLGSPDIKKWFNKGGTIILESMDNGSYVWKYVSKNGDIISYVPEIIGGKLYNVISFPQKYLHPDVGVFSIDAFTGVRKTDMKLALEYLYKYYGFDKIPAGYILHHDIKSGVFQLVESAIHKEFSHYGGHYFNKLVQALSGLIK